MKKKGRRPNTSDDLRMRAEETLEKRVSGLKTQTPDDTARLIHELEVHQIELEMQNEELRRAQVELEESRSRYSDLYDFAPMGYFVLDSNGLIMNLNLTGAALLGVERGHLIGKPFNSFIAKEDKDQFYSHRRKILGVQGRDTCEIRLCKKDGTVFYAQLESQAKEDSKGSISHLRTAITDITERKHVTEELQKANEHISSILESITDAFVSIDHNWRYTYVNHSAAKLLGKTREQMLGNVLWDIFPGVKGSQFDKEFHRAVIQNVPVHFESFYPPHNAWYDCHCYPSDDGLSIFFTNINERKEIELRQELTGRILDCFNRKDGGLELIRDVIALIKEYTGFAAVGIRLREGDDFPFFETSGFPPDFVKTENYLCAHDESGKTLYDSTGHPVLECICGHVLSGQTDPKLPFFTEGGSFWANSTTELLKSGLPGKYQGRTRNRCHQTGYESVALVPLRSDRKFVGLLQFNDILPGRFTPELIRFFERIGITIGIAIARIRAELEVIKLNRELEQRVAERTTELEEVNKKLLQQIKSRQQLEKEILLVSERAQRLIGQELHDDVGQLFAGTALMLKALQKKLATTLPDEVSYVEKIMKLVGQAIDHTKQISRGLAPMNLEADNLLLSLRELATGAEDLGIHCTVKGDEKCSQTDTAMALHLYRIAQESINNAIKHGKAKTIQIKLACDSDCSKLTVESDGLDFPEVLPESKGMGLRIMRYRSELINGSLDVHRGIQGGTIVTCVVPNQNS